MATTKKSLELDTRIEAIICEEYAEFERYLPTPQEAERVLGQNPRKTKGGRNRWMSS